MMRFSSILLVLSLSTMLAGNVLAAPLVTGDLVFYYGFDTVSGTTVTDGSGNDYDGTITGSVTQTTGPLGNAAQFWHDGVDEYGTDWNFITLPVDSMPSATLPTDAITLAAWYNVDPGTELQSLFNTWSTNDVWATTCVMNRETEDSYRFTLRDYYNYDIVECRTVDDGPNWNVWTHIAMTFSAATETMNVYENGQLIGTAAATSTSPLLNDWGDENEATDGSTRVSTEGDNCRQIMGSLDEFYVFSRALTESEINLMVAAGSIPGDTNFDRVVNDNDAATLAENWLAGDATWAMGDFNDDGLVNELDATLLAANWQTGTAPGASVPEPSCLVLLGALFVAFGFYRRATRLA